MKNRTAHQRLSLMSIPLPISAQDPDPWRLETGLLVMQRLPYRPCTFSLVTFIVLIMYLFRVYLPSVPLLCALRTISILFVATSLHPERFLTHSVHFINSHSVIRQTLTELGCLQK